MKRPGPARGLEAKARHDFEGAFPEARAISREKDFSVPLGHFQRSQEQCFEILLDLKCLASMRPRECRGIKDNDIELLPFSRQSRQDFHDIIGDETMIIRWQRIQGKVFARARQRFF